MYDIPRSLSEQAQNLKLIYPFVKNIALLCCTTMLESACLCVAKPIHCLITSSDIHPDEQVRNIKHT